MKNKIKIFSAIFISILLTIFLSNYLFLNGTTKVNPTKLTDLANNIRTLVKLPFSWLSPSNNEKDMAKTPSLKPTSFPIINPNQPSQTPPSLIPTNTYPIPSSSLPYATSTISPNTQVTQLAQGVYSIRQDDMYFIRVDNTANAYYKEVTLINGTKVLFFNYE